jgi:hypothetical protein
MSDETKPVLSGSTDLLNGDALKKYKFPYFDSIEKTEKTATMQMFISGLRAFNNDMHDAQKVLSERSGTLSDQILGVRQFCPNLEAFEGTVKNIRDMMKWGAGEEKTPQPNWFRDYVSLVISSEKNLGLIIGQETEITGTITNDVTGEIEKHAVLVTPNNISSLKRLSAVARKNQTKVKKVTFTGFEKGLKIEGSEHEELVDLLRAVSSHYMTGGTSDRASVLEVLTDLVKASDKVSEILGTDKVDKQAAK